jgi:hypothetical protein
MELLRRLLGGPAQLPPAPVVPVGADVDEEEQLCTVTVGSVTVPAAIYQGYQRDIGDWSSGIRLDDPDRGFRLMRDSDSPPFLAAGARSIALAGITYHADAQRDEFAVGHFVQLASEPTNQVNPNAIAIRSLEGRYHAGYVFDEDLERIQATEPTPVVGLVVWEHGSRRPRKRFGLRILVGPSIHVELISAVAAPAERARRTAHYARGQAAWEAERDTERAAATEHRRAAARELARQGRVAKRDAAEAQKSQSAAWRAAGLCVECGAAIEERPGRGRPAIRCAVHFARPAAG